jgi:hypothetical protein
MKRTIVAASLAIGFFLAGSAHAGWGVCSGCHNGAMAINKEGMLAKYTSVEALIKGAQAVENPMMAKIKQDVEGLKAAALELGLKPEKQ